VAPSAPAAPAGQRRMAAFVYPPLGIAAVIGAWTALYLLAVVPEYSLPSPWSVVSAMVTEADILLPDLVITIKEFLLGLAMSLISGLVLGVLIVDSKTIGRVIYPMIVAAQVVPKIAIGPIILVWFGFGMFSNALIGALIAFFPAAIATITGLRSVQPEKLDLALSMGAGRLRTLLRVRLPSALPTLMAGVRLATIYAVTGAVIGEFIGSDEGIGKRILEASAAFSTEIVFAATAYVVLLGFAAFGAVAFVEARVIHWHQSRRRLLV
jgi:NitT/TauT family transport system permease protein